MNGMRFLIIKMFYACPSTSVSGMLLDFEPTSRMKHSSATIANGVSIVKNTGENVESSKMISKSRLHPRMSKLHLLSLPFLVRRSLLLLRSKSCKQTKKMKKKKRRLPYRWTRKRKRATLLTMPLMQAPALATKRQRCSGRRVPADVLQRSPSNRCLRLTKTTTRAMIRLTFPLATLFPPQHTVIRLLVLGATSILCRTIITTFCWTVSRKLIRLQIIPGPRGGFPIQNVHLRPKMVMLPL